MILIKQSDKNLELIKDKKDTLKTIKVKEVKSNANIQS